MNIVLIHSSMVDCCCRCRAYRCRELSQSRCFEDSESVESVEIVGDGAPGGGKRRKKTTRQPRTTRKRTTTRQARHNMGDESTIRTTPAMVYVRGGAGGKASKGSCPGSLEDCIEACPSKVARVYTLCVAKCGRVCGNK